MNQKDFQRLLRRDNEACYHCATDDQTLIPQHRKNRGAGGSKLGDRPSNLITLCSLANSLAESDANFAALCRAYNWKLNSYQDSLKEPVYEMATGKWWRLDDSWGRHLDPYRN